GDIEIRSNADKSVKLSGGVLKASLIADEGVEAAGGVREASIPAEEGILARGVQLPRPIAEKGIVTAQETTTGVVATGFFAEESIPRSTGVGCACETTEEGIIIRRIRKPGIAPEEGIVRATDIAIPSTGTEE